MLLFLTSLACSAPDSVDVPWGYAASFECEDGTSGLGAMLVVVDDDDAVVESAEFGRDDGAGAYALERTTADSLQVTAPLTTLCDAYVPEEGYLRVRNIYGDEAVDPDPGAVPSGLNDTGA